MMEGWKEGKRKGGEGGGGGGGVQNILNGPSCEGTHTQRLGKILRLQTNERKHLFFVFFFFAFLFCFVLCFFLGLVFLAHRLHIIIMDAVATRETLESLARALLSDTRWLDHHVPSAGDDSDVRIAEDAVVVRTLIDALPPGFLSAHHFFDSESQSHGPPQLDPVAAWFSGPTGGRSAVPGARRGDIHPGRQARATAPKMQSCTVGSKVADQGVGPLARHMGGPDDSLVARASALLQESTSIRSRAGRV
jgi:hypothetical protein